jgi:hypothetical protein
MCECVCVRALGALVTAEKFLRKARIGSHAWPRKAVMYMHMYMYMLCTLVPYLNGNGTLVGVGWGSCLVALVVRF